MANDLRDHAQSASDSDSASSSLAISRRGFLAGSAVFSLAQALPAIAAPKLDSRRILVGSNSKTTDGILSFAWDPATGSLKPEGVAAKITNSTWLGLSPDRRFLYVASEVDEFEGKPTGAVASYALANGKLTPISILPAEGKGTCHLTTDHTGHIVICANYAGGSAASFVATQGKLSGPAWMEHYPGYLGADGKPTHGPNADRQEAAHAHFISLSPDNRFVYINDLGADRIHIYKLDAATGKLAHAGDFKSHAGAGPRTLHFHPAGKFAYVIDELDSTVNVVAWNAADGSLSLVQQVELLPPNSTGTSTSTSTACDTVLTRDGNFAYFANRGNDFLMSFRIDAATGKLTPLSGSPRTSCGGKTPRNFTLDPSERWMLVANQGSSNLSVFARDPKTGELANEGRNFAAATPMCIVFV